MKAIQYAAQLLTLTLPLAAQTHTLPLSDPTNQGGWSLSQSLSDEFNGTALDRSKWKTTLTGWEGRPPAHIVDEAVAVDDGALTIQMNKQGDRYTTGAVQSTGTVLYGYFEVRARAMPSAGSSAFWLVAKDEHNWNELDVFEAGGRPPADPARVFHSGHVFLENGLKVDRHSTTDVHLKQAASQAFHVYGLQWGPGWIQFYIDGHLERRLKNTSWHLPATLILDAETQADWWGLPLDADLPSLYTIEYVRVWKQATKP